MVILSACHQRRARFLNETNQDIQHLKITKLAGGNYCGIDQSKDLVIKSNDEWKDLWKRVHQRMIPQPVLPEIDFTRETVLAVFLGSRSTGGYSIEISHLKEDNQYITAVVKTRSPEPGGMVTTALSQPYHIVKVYFADKDIRFIRE